MIVTIKTLQQKTFKVEIEDTQNVKALKQKIEDDQGEEFPADSLKLIYAGKILENEAPLSKYKIQENNFVVVMVSKARAPPKPAAEETSTSDETAPSGETTTAGETSATPQETSTPSESSQPQAQTETTTTTTTTTAEAEGSARTETSQATPTAPSGDTAATEGTDEVLQQAGSVLVTGSEYEDAIMNLMALGYERDIVVRALNSSFNNPDRAAEMLMSNTVPDSFPVPQQEEGTSEQPTRDVPTGGQAAGSQVGQAGQAPTSGEGNPLEFLRTRPQFQLLQQMVRSDPQMLQPLLQQIGQSNPQLIQLISQNQQSFIDLLNQSPADSSASSGASTPSAPTPTGTGTPPAPSALPQGMIPPGGLPPGMQMPPGGLPPGGLPPGVIQVTPQEKEAIERLKGLGFPEHLVIQAYFACEKNEEMAANFLLQQDNVDD